MIAGDKVRQRLARAGGARGEQPPKHIAVYGTWHHRGRVMRRRWNGDETDYGFNFAEEPVLLKVRLGTYR
jgi:hypothetical protein